MAFSLKDIPSGTGGVLEPGQYNVKFTDVEPGVSQAGNAKLTVKGFVTAGPATDRKVFLNRTLTQGAIWKLKDDLLAAGIPEDQTFANPFNDPQAFAQDVKSILVGKMFDVRVEHQTQTSGQYAGKTNAEYTILGKSKLSGNDAFDSV